MTEVEPGISCPSNSKHSVGICLIVIAESSYLVGSLDKLIYLGVIDPGVLRVCYKNRGSSIRERCFEGVDALRILLRWA